MISILIVDDHPVFRAGIVKLLELEADFRVIGQAATGEAAIQLLARQRPDIVLLDLSLQGISGLETLRRMRIMAPNVRVIILTSSEAAEDAHRAVLAGAKGFLTKIVDQPQIAATIRDVHAGKKRFQDSFTSIDKPSPLNLSGLTPREVEVLQQARTGRSNADIARTMGITVRTVKAHMTAILDKLGASDRAGALVRGFELGILKLPPHA